MVDYESISIVDLAGIVAEHLQSHGVRVVLVGGLAVEIYSENLYLTKDIDMVNVSHDPVARIIKSMDEKSILRKRGAGRCGSDHRKIVSNGNGAKR